MPKTIAIDFDGVIHKYSQGYKDGSIYDEPIDGAFETIKTLMENGYSVYILSTRSPRQIKRWLDKQLWFWDSFAPDDKHYLFGYDSRIIPFWKKFWNKEKVLGITNRKLPAVVYIDDRALKFESWNKIIKEIEHD